ncbi:MAG: FKBP-type peptidyl-prolyl cis-trans isomerase, partial [Planctomycetaceae bacterium]
MLRRLILGMAAVAVLLVVLSNTRPSTRQRILKVAGPVDADAPREFSVTDSGLRYRVLRKGQGRHPQPTDTITVNYAGWLDDGTQFDSSYKSPQPFVT